MKITLLGEIAEDVVGQWCIDARQIFLAGHSDGATAALALTLDIPMTPRPAALLLSGAGWTVPELEEVGCAAPTPVLIAHGSQDRHFPGYGKPLAQWFATCNRCKSYGVSDENGCTQFFGCAAETMYCETPRNHWRWAIDPAPAIRFLALQRQRLGSLPARRG